MPQKKMKRVELISPGGTIEKLRIALYYGADAVYLSGKEFGLRRRAGNLSMDEISQATEEAHSLGKKVYLTMNIFAHNRHVERIRKYCEDISYIGLDAVIVSDPGVFSVVSELLPNIPIHISTQANTTNIQSARFWEKLGARRVILARELSLEEISQIANESTIDLEVFVHGAMCISYSGRCLLSSYLADRNANLGDCGQPCRWEYKLIEKERPNEMLAIEEDDEYTYVMNSRDLCTIEHIPELIASGVSAFKIEGRMKSMYYVAAVTRLYREAIDQYYNDPESYQVDPTWATELECTTTKGFTTGFYFGNPLSDGQKYDVHKSPIDQSFLGVVTNAGREDGLVEIQAKNKITPGIEIICMSPKRSLDRAAHVSGLFDQNMNAIDKTGPNQIVLVKLSEPTNKFNIIRRK